MGVGLGRRLLPPSLALGSTPLFVHLVPDIGHLNHPTCHRLHSSATLVDDMSEGNSWTRLERVFHWLVVALVPTIAFILLWATTPPVSMGEIASASLEAILLTLGRLTGLALTGWLLTSQLLYTAAIITRADWLSEVLRPVTLPVVRRVAAGITTVSISFNSLVAVAQTEPTPTVITVEQANLRQEATPTPILQPLVEPEIQESCIVVEPEGSYSTPLTWLVRPGDHLWRIAGEHLAIVLDRPPTPDEHRRYWVEVMEAARPVIRSGNVDLIYPGEEIPLPPTLEAGVRP